MTGSELAAARVAFHHAITHETGGEAPWQALERLAKAIVGVKLFTFLEADMQAGISRRAYTSDPESYPTSGSKPINRTHWFDTIHVERRPFVANTIKDIAEVFPDHELIWSLGCGSVVNLPITLSGDFVGTLNLLHEEQFYTGERVNLIETELAGPTQLAYLAAKRLAARPGTAQ